MSKRSKRKRRGHWERKPPPPRPDDQRQFDPEVAERILRRASTVPPPNAVDLLRRDQANAPEVAR